jgi:hypothetical protein
MKKTYKVKIGDMTYLFGNKKTAFDFISAHLHLGGQEATIKIIERSKK